MRLIRRAPGENRSENWALRELELVRSRTLGRATCSSSLRQANSVNGFEFAAHSYAQAVSCELKTVQAKRLLAACGSSCSKNLLRRVCRFVRACKFCARARETRDPAVSRVSRAARASSALRALENRALRERATREANSCASHALAMPARAAVFARAEIFAKTKISENFAKRNFRRAQKWCTSWSGRRARGALTGLARPSA